jgi:hypothetical protein
MLAISLSDDTGATAGKFIITEIYQSHQIWVDLQAQLAPTPHTSTHIHKDC